MTHSSGVLSIMVVKSRRQEHEAVSHIFSGTREGGTLMITYLCPFYIVPDTGNWASLLKGGLIDLLKIISNRHQSQ